MSDYNTPLYRAVEKYINSDFARLHTPGHKGEELGFLTAVTPYDITEIRGADSLFSPTGAIADTETRYSAYYGTASTCLSAGGSTLCIQAMLRLVSEHGSHIIIGRNAHASAINAMALLGLEPLWCCPSQSDDLLPEPVSPTQVEKLLRENSNVAAVYVTSPDYFGKLTDIAGISALCHSFGIPLLVDNAHGSALEFFGKHPIQLGADMCCDSLHKTLPVLTGGALLHIANSELSRKLHFAEKAKAAMALFGSTSPSYLTMLSMDILLERLESGELSSAMVKTARLVENLQKSIPDLLPAGDCEPTRLSFVFGKCGCTAEEIDALLTANAIEPEYLSEHCCVLLFGADTPTVHYKRVEKLLAALPHKTPLPAPWDFTEPICSVSIRKAMLSAKEELPTEHCVNRICGEVVSRCPPGIPLVVFGELLTSEHVKILKTYGITALSVLK